MIAAARPHKAASIGVLVSSCAKETAPKTFSSTCPGSPALMAASAAATAAVSWRTERSALEKSARNRIGKQGKAGGGRTCEAERDLIGARLCRGERAVIAGGAPDAIRGTITAAIATETTPSGSS